MRNIDSVLSRLYGKLGIDKDIDFCKKYDFKPNTVSTWKKRGSIPYDRIIEISQNANISLDYILTGTENKISSNIDYKNEIISNLEQLNESQMKYVYHITEAEKIKRNL